MRLSVDSRLPMPSSAQYDELLNSALYRLLREFAAQINGISEGQIQAVTNKATAAPTAGSYNQGDKIWNSAPEELGSGGSKYLILGWCNVAAGIPGTWKEMRVLTGN